jgi:hypothetical protein
MLISRYAVQMFKDRQHMGPVLPHYFHMPILYQEKLTCLKRKIKIEELKERSNTKSLFYVKRMSVFQIKNTPKDGTDLHKYNISIVQHSNLHTKKG